MMTIAFAMVVTQRVWVPEVTLQNDKWKFNEQRFRHDDTALQTSIITLILQVTAFRVFTKDTMKAQLLLQSFLVCVYTLFVRSMDLNLENLAKSANVGSLWSTPKKIEDFSICSRELDRIAATSVFLMLLSAVVFKSLVSFIVNNGHHHEWAAVQAYEFSTAATTAIKERLPHIKGACVAGRKPFDPTDSKEERAAKIKKDKTPVWMDWVVGGSGVVVHAFGDCKLTPDVSVEYFDFFYLLHDIFKAIYLAYRLTCLSSNFRDPITSEEDRQFVAMIALFLQHIRPVQRYKSPCLNDSTYCNLEELNLDSVSYNVGCQSWVFALGLMVISSIPGWVLTGLY